MSKTCYFCGNAAESKEHVPPRVLFPEATDVPDRKNYRAQLITVPSCYEHNSATSKDDEYLVYILAMGLTSNALGKHQFLTKVMRAIEKKPALIASLLKTKQHVIVHDTVTDKWSRTIALQVDETRLSRTYEKIARGLLFHETNATWPGTVDVLTEYTMSLDDRAGNDETQQIVRSIDRQLTSVDRKGANPDVFTYQIASQDEAHIARLRFYGETNVTCILQPAAGLPGVAAAAAQVPDLS